MGGSLQHWVLLCEPHRRWVEGEPTYDPNGRLPLGQNPKLGDAVHAAQLPRADREDQWLRRPAMDNFFTSPTLLLCLETHKIYGVGTVRTNRIGLKGAVELFRAEGSKLSNKGDMNFARSGTLAVVEWKDTKIVTLASTIHNTKKDFEPQPFE